MRKAILAALLGFLLQGAAPDPVTWKVTGAGKAVRAGTRFNVKVTAKVEPGWHLYSLKPMPEGPIPTRIWIPEGQPFQLAGKIEATEPQTLHDPTFNLEVEQYEGDAEFTVPVKASAAGTQTLNVSASYQTCNNKLCLPPKTVKLEVPVTVAK